MNIAVFAVVVGLALVAAGCGGDDGESSATPTAEWAEGYCAAIVDWIAERRRTTDRLRDFRSLSLDTFAEASADLRTATEAFTEELRALGAPDTAFGEEARQAVDMFVTATDDARADMERAVEDISGLSGISTAIVSITAALNSINESFTTMAKSLIRLDPERELHGAFEKAESCDELGG
jgi:hypothetical protein